MDLPGKSNWVIWKSGSREEEGGPGQDESEESYRYSVGLSHSARTFAESLTPISSSAAF